MNIPFKVKLLTPTAKPPQRNCESDLWDLFADNFESLAFKNNEWILDEQATVYPQSRILIRTGIAIELPVLFNEFGVKKYWVFNQDLKDVRLEAYAVADIRPRSGLALKHGITVINTPGTIDNSYRKEIGVILINHGHEPYTIEKGDKIAQMLIRPLYLSSFEIVKDFEDTGRGGFGSTGTK
jgi:deoxyuridine 5'-triphosphate nucleotidohydrolase